MAAQDWTSSLRGGGCNHFTPPFSLPVENYRNCRGGGSWTRGGIFEREGRGESLLVELQKEIFGESKEVKKKERGGLIGRIGTALYSYFSLLNFPGTWEWKSFLPAAIREAFANRFQKLKMLFLREKKLTKLYP